jgi:regulator of sirC expression with transglutaminase-like and TPR domain
MAISAPSPQRRAFADLVRRADREIDLARAALLIAQEEYPTLDAAAVLAHLDRLAARVRARLGRPGDGPIGPPPLGSIAQDAPAVIDALNAVLFGEEGFRGNHAEYYDPRNSFLNEVLARRTGIPITISLVYMEVAARVGLPLQGIGMPGHFIVRYAGPWSDPARPNYRPQPGELFIDPYFGGALRTRADCAARFRQIYGPDFTFSEEYLTPLSRHQILARMLSNLKAIYLKRHDYRRAASVVERLLLVQPEAVWEFKDRGILYYRLGAFQPARADLQHFLAEDPDAEDAPIIRYYIDLCSRLLTLTN